ncbi:GNAT family N-acetyltransferase [Salsipaludibacter albus]|uniref:GNAT family N-acetyltransferase n=1 Tax=Salsipaludibacter albus TaxID=2849650 RepID=UPI001EE3C3BD|nr:GNAT family N-acetyltransferase [Salsipaludibacter albus]MBY5161416.1 GNAT family N-acetyltransferase [Salsipaludibacter albus]
MDEAPRVRPATDDDRVAVRSLTADAFGVDPLIRWFFPDPDTFEAMARSFFGTLLDLRLRAGVVEVEVDQRGAAQWERPGGLGLSDQEQDDAWAGHVGRRGAVTRARFDLLEDLFGPHVPDEPHWYLGVLAVDPSHHRRGIGSSLLRVGLERARADGLAAFLETATADNVGLYERHGFVVTGEVDLPDDGPHVWFMTARLD